MSNKQSSLDFYRKNLHSMVSGGSTEFKTEVEIFEKAKAMHKEEQIDSLINGMYKGQEMYFSEHKVKLDDNSTVFCAAIAEHYYNSTFGGQQ